MTRLSLVSLWTVATALSHCCAGAEESSPATKQPATAAEAAPANTKSRAISPAIAAQLASVAPKYEPAAETKSTEVAKPAETTDLREIDKPRNTIHRLPPYLVEEKAPPVMKERELSTPKARLETALKRHPGLRFGSFWIFSNDGVALAMQAEEERLDRMREMNDLVSLLPASQYKDGKAMVDRAFMRSGDMR